MKFDRLLNLYWRKIFFISNYTLPFDSTFKDFRSIFGINRRLIIDIIKKLELGLKWYDKTFDISQLSWKKRRIINIILAKTYNVNFNLNELIRMNLIRLYLIKSYRGRCHMLSKPVKGQQTWSNANTPKYYSKILKKNITYMLKKNEQKNISKKNYFILIKKKTKRVIPKLKKISKLDSLLIMKKWL